MSRHMFFGGNTPDGFFGCFEDILFLGEARKMIYLKGSSGSGKSTLMRKVAAAFKEKGIAVDYIHCSNSIHDLDGICIRSLGISMIDATAPHVCDPIVPVAIDEIFNLADFIDPKHVRKYADELVKRMEQKKPYYTKAYSYLNAAAKVFSNNTYMYQQAVKESRLTAVIEKETARFYQEPVSDTKGLNRRLFASAISPQGKVSYLDSLIKGMAVIGLQGENGMGMAVMLKDLRDAANSRGYYTESCMCTLDKEKLDHLLIPELNLAYITLNDYHTTKEPCERIIDFKELCDQEELAGKEAEISYNKKIFEELLKRSMNMMDAQKEVHDRIEEIYIAGMDFAGVDQAFDRIMNIIEASLVDL